MRFCRTGSVTDPKSAPSSVAAPLAVRRPATPRRLGVTGRLLVLVLLPLAALTVVSGPLVLQTRRDSERAKAIVANVPEVTSLIGAVAALEVEQGKVDAVLHPAEVGVPVAVAGELLGLDLVAEMRSARTATDRALRTLSYALAEPIVSTVGALRRLVDRGAAKSSVVDALFQQTESDLNALSTSKLKELERAAVLDVEHANDQPFPRRARLDE